MVRIWAAILLLVSFGAHAQDTLPKFTATTRGGNKVIISWTNAYPTITQISIQRSFDSTRNFRTILTVPDPTVQQNGFVDTKASTPYMYYRLFIVLANGEYVFSKVQRAYWDTGAIGQRQPSERVLVAENNNRRVVIADNMPVKEAAVLKDKLQEVIKPKRDSVITKVTPAPEPEKYFTVKKRDSIILRVPEKAFKKFRDSIVYKTKDTMAFKNLDTILIRPFVPREIYKPSLYVFTDRDGNVVINLPDASQKKYQVRFFEEDQSPLFEVKQVKSPMLIVDKSNFLHSGWFRFELYEEEKLKEKHRFFIPKDF